MSEKSQKKKTLWFVLTGIIGLAACIGIYCGYQAYMRKAEELRQEKSRVEQEAKRAAEAEKLGKEMRELVGRIEERRAAKEAAQKQK